jgi:PadR family transcriptional regulator PadR
LGAGQVYPALRALERNGLVESYPGETAPERAGRPRIYYRLTGAGRRVALGEPRAAEGFFAGLPAAAPA